MLVCFSAQRQSSGSVSLLSAPVRAESAPAALPQREPKQGNDGGQDAGKQQFGGPTPQARHPSSLGGRRNCERPDHGITRRSEPRLLIPVIVRDVDTRGRLFQREFGRPVPKGRGRRSHFGLRSGRLGVRSGRGKLALTALGQQSSARILHGRIPRSAGGRYPSSGQWGTATEFYDRRSLKFRGGYPHFRVDCSRSRRSVPNMRDRSRSFIKSLPPTHPPHRKVGNAMSKLRTLGAVLIAATWFGVACGSASSLPSGAAGGGVGESAASSSGAGRRSSAGAGSGASSAAHDGSNGGSAADAGDGAADAGDSAAGTGANGNHTAGGAANGSNAGGGAVGANSGCKAFNESCAGGKDCCSGVCDPKSNTCASVLTTCAAANDACAAATDCCSLRCENKKCAAAACISDSGKCGADSECCGGKCTNGACVALNSSCETSGNACTAETADKCCSKTCLQGKCSLGVSFCIQPGDVCSRAQDCCSGGCTIAVGNKLGTCDVPPSGPSFCSGVDGVVCGGCGDCCSRLCAPFGPSGVKICQPASGCHVTGDLCRKNSDCCGGTLDSSLPGYGNVTCQIAAGKTIGICRNPVNGPSDGGACNPQGNVCHLKNYACDISSARADCCGGLGAKGGVCEVDPLGVPRCNGLGTSCRAGGETCASNADCCNDVPCIPDAQGQLRCLTGGPTCSPSGGSCTINGDCCTGYTLHLARGLDHGNVRQHHRRWRQRRRQQRRRQQRRRQQRRRQQRRRQQRRNIRERRCGRREHLR